MLSKEGRLAFQSYDNIPLRSRCPIANQTGHPDIVSKQRALFFGFLSIRKPSGKQEALQAAAGTVRDRGRDAQPRSRTFGINRACPDPYDCHSPTFRVQYMTWFRSALYEASNVRKRAKEGNSGGPKVRVILRQSGGKYLPLSGNGLTKTAVALPVTNI